MEKIKFYLETVKNWVTLNKKKAMFIGAAAVVAVVLIIKKMRG